MLASDCAMHALLLCGFRVSFGRLTSGLILHSSTWSVVWNSATIYLAKESFIFKHLHFTNKHTKNDTIHISLHLCMKHKMHLELSGQTNKIETILINILPKTAWNTCPMMNKIVLSKGGEIHATYWVLFFLKVILSLYIFLAVPYVNNIQSMS